MAMSDHSAVYAASVGSGRSGRDEMAARLRSAFVAMVFFAVILLSVGTMVWSIAGVPVRAAAAIAALGLMTVMDRRSVATALRRQSGLLLLTAGAALLGIIVSLFNAMPITDLLQQIIEIHVQSAVFLVLAALVAEICGGPLLVLTFAAGVGVSALFAAAQFFGVEAAWSIRDAIAAISKETIRYERSRPPGLALTPVSLATHLTLALAMILVLRQRLNEAAGKPRRFDPVVVLAVAAFSLVCLVSGNRSPMLGAAVFLAIYSASRSPRLFLLVSPLILMALPLAFLGFEALQSTGMRAFETADKSSAGREVLAAYGSQLFLERPVGYGLGFNPTLYWGDHVELLMKFGNPAPATLFELHNYILTMFNYYGLGVLMLLPPSIRMIRRHSAYVLPFLPYIIHILFHNYGPFAKDDALIFVALVAVTMPLGRSSARPASAARTSGLRARAAPT